MRSFFFAIFIFVVLYFVLLQMKYFLEEDAVNWGVYRKEWRG